MPASVCPQAVRKKPQMSRSETRLDFQARGAVSVKEANVAIPTHAVGDPDPNPNLSYFADKMGQNPRAMQFIVPNDSFEGPRGQV
jgi:hypothetical protein